ncbi:HD domain-containing protein [Paludisphaera mucosa]|uniref:HD domain-containing protein n=1 Tax=Paludisphaera mucosa TaxID=3030827 RepID=A0ABT6FCR2_9BACT|nr:HD domain-containing protein [Paludisphaera mucosa]MDG3005173.1 HD domain-containing protein [Paludisphaera mucosa]
MQWNDRVYGRVQVDDPEILDLIEGPTFQRLRGIRQAGPSAIAFPFKNVTRFEHSLGVFILLRRLGAPLKEQVAGLLHDVSHTAFSHAVDFLVTSAEQDHHESLKPILLRRPDVVAALDRLGFVPEDFFDDSRYPLLERPLPWLCADRLDYFLRDGIACQAVHADHAARILGAAAVVDSTIVFTDPDVARLAAGLFDVMNRDWWASDVEAYIYNEFADALRIAFRQGALAEDDLLSEDDKVLAKLDAARIPAVDAVLSRIRRFDPALAEDYAPRIAPKQRRIDPPVQVGSGFQRLSHLH